MAFAILATMAGVVGYLTVHRLRTDFMNQVVAQAENIAPTVRPSFSGDWGVGATATGGAIRIYSDDGRFVIGTSNAPNLGTPSRSTNEVNGYAVATVRLSFGRLVMQYGIPDTQLTNEVGRLELFLAIGVLGGTLLAFAAGSYVARRAITPIAELTAAAAEIERTRDPTRTLPEPTAEDEVAELTRTLSGMLAALGAARNEAEASLERQRAFVADASHELRTPLTSVLANLELLVDSLSDTDREIAQSALRSTQRMRRLVGDLLLLARADAHRAPVREPLDLSEAVVLAASELEPAARDHVISLDVAPAPTVGSRDDLQRVATNLIENAVRHTPPGTHVIASTRPLEDGGAELVVADDGPGIPPEMRDTLFQRFVRGAGDRGGSFGLGLAIVAAVAQSHGGTVTADESPHGGARFTVRLPAHEPDVAPTHPSRLWLDRPAEAAPDATPGY